MHVDVYLENKTDTVVIKYPPGWEVKTASRKVGSPGTCDPTDLFDRIYVEVAEAKKK